MIYNFKRDATAAVIEYGTKIKRTTAQVFIDADTAEKTINIYASGSVGTTSVNLNSDTLQIEGTSAGNDVAVIVDRLTTEVFLKVNSGSGGSGVSSVAVAFSQSIPFSNFQSIMNKVVDAAYTFTPNTTGAVVGNSTLLRIVADGINIPSFSGFQKLSASDNYNNTNGRVHLVNFVYDGTDYNYSIAQSYTIIDSAYSYLTWTGKSAGVSEASNGLAYTGGVNSFGHVARSNEQLASGHRVVFGMAGQVGGYQKVLGLTKQTSFTGLAQVDYSFYITAGDIPGDVGVIEAGAYVGQKGTYAGTDVLSIFYSGSSILYQKSVNNGNTWTTLYTSLAAPSGTYYVVGDFASGPSGGVNSSNEIKISN